MTKRAQLGRLERSRDGDWAPSGRRERAGCDRARLWHRLRLGVAGSARCAAGRRGRLADAGFDRAEAQTEHGLEFPLLLANAEAVPLRDESFDLAISEYGAATWCEPRYWLPEAARLLRSHGRLIFLTATPILSICTPDDGTGASERLTRILRHEPVRVGAQRLGRVPTPVWAMGSCAAQKRLRHRGSHRDSGPGGLLLTLALCRIRVVGASLAI